MYFPLCPPDSPARSLQPSAFVARDSPGSGVNTQRSGSFSRTGAPSSLQPHHVISTSLHAHRSGAMFAPSCASVPSPVCVSSAQNGSASTPSLALLRVLPERELKLVEHFAVLCRLERQVEAQVARLSGLRDRMHAQNARLQFQLQQPRHLRADRGNRRQRDRSDDEDAGFESEGEEGKSTSLLLNDAGQPLPSNSDAIHIWTLRNRLQHFSKGSSRAKLSAAASKAGALVCVSTAVGRKTRGAQGKDLEKKVNSLLAGWDNARGDPGWSSAVLRWQLDRLKVKRRRRVKKEEEEGDDEEDGDVKSSEHAEKEEEEEEGEGVMRERMAGVSLRVFRAFVKELYRTLVSIPIPEHAVRALFDHCRLQPSPLALPALPSASELADDSFLPATPGELHPSKLLYATRSLLLAWRRLALPSASFTSVSPGDRHGGPLPARVPSFAEVLRAVCTAVSASLPKSVSWAFTPSECLSNFVTSVQPSDASLLPSLFLPATRGGEQRPDSVSSSASTVHVHKGPGEQGCLSAGAPGPSSWDYGSMSLPSLSRECTQGVDAPEHDFRLLATVEEAILRGLRQVLGGASPGKATDENALGHHALSGPAPRPVEGTARAQGPAGLEERGFAEATDALALAVLPNAGAQNENTETKGDTCKGASLVGTGTTLDGAIRAILARPEKVPILYFSSLLTQPVPPFAVFQVYLHLRKRSTEQHGLVCHRRWWSPEEDAALLRAVDTMGVQQRGAGKWMKVAALLPGRTNNQCRARYLYLAVEGKRHGLFSALEDLRLQVLVSCYGRGSWGKIARHLRGRTEMKCRERYENCLHDESKTLLWTSSEMSLLRVAADFFQQDWPAVARVICGRPAQQCREKFEELETEAEIEQTAIQFLRRFPEIPVHQADSWEAEASTKSAVVAWAEAHLLYLLRFFVCACGHLFADSVRKAASEGLLSFASFPAFQVEEPREQEGPLETNAKGGSQETHRPKRQTDVRGTGERERLVRGIDAGPSPAARSAAIQFAKYLEALYALLLPASRRSAVSKPADPLSGAQLTVVGSSLGSRDVVPFQGESGTTVSPEQACLSSFPPQCPEPRSLSSPAPFTPSAMWATAHSDDRFPALGDRSHLSSACPPNSLATALRSLPSVSLQQTLSPNSPASLSPLLSFEKHTGASGETLQGSRGPEVRTDASGASGADEVEIPSDAGVACLFLLLAVEKGVGLGLGEQAPRLASLYKKGIREWKSKLANKGETWEDSGTVDTGKASPCLDLSETRSQVMRIGELREETLETIAEVPHPHQSPLGSGSSCLPDPRRPAHMAPAVAVSLLQWLAVSGGAGGPRPNRASESPALEERQALSNPPAERDGEPSVVASDSEEHAQTEVCSEPSASEGARGQSNFDKLVGFMSHEKGQSYATVPAKRPALRCLQQRPLPAALVEAATQAAATEMKLRGLDPRLVSDASTAGKDRRKKANQVLSRCSRATRAPTERGQRLPQRIAAGLEVGSESRIDERLGASQEVESSRISQFRDQESGGNGSKTRRYYAQVPRRQVSARGRQREGSGRGRRAQEGSTEGGPDDGDMKEAETEETGEKRGHMKGGSKRGRSRGVKKGGMEEPQSALERPRRGRKGGPEICDDVGEKHRDQNASVEDGRNGEKGWPTAHVEERQFWKGDTETVDETHTQRVGQRKRDEKNRDETEMQPGEIFADSGVAEGLPIGSAGEVDVGQMCERAVVGLPLVDGRTGKKFTEVEAYTIAREVEEKIQAMYEAPKPAE
ncbi:Myb family DNA-binding domain-containing protein [Toxoplasma gondii RUB]|uniref:Myb family DNA-binding domain-containing protein n=1 Tax=Toxoplasma gondii RUB TaxID=935652 RepID=A0A086LKP0_TOXGO|nr:Myb family DNA-binding domain-containing protein [Toxoplasma gondii RUB]